MSGFTMLPDLHFHGGKPGWTDPRRLPREGLAQALVETRSRTLAWLAALGPGARSWTVPRQYDADPPAWILGHIAWQAEWWCLRDVNYVDRGGLRLPVPAEQPLLDGADAWFDPSRIGPDERWEMSLPEPSVVKQYAADVLDGILRRVALLPDDSDATLYPFRRALFHEDAQGESVATLVQALGVAPAEPTALVPSLSASISLPYAGTLQFPGGQFIQGWRDPDGFALPDERPPQRTYVPAFEIDAAPVSNAHFLEFVEDGGYEHPAWWSAAGRQWLMMQERSAPRYWSRHPQTRTWLAQRFGRDRTLNPDEPVRHVSLFEVQAWCLWAGRRLPTEVEWEMAAARDHGNFRWGMVYEWTATPYEPYAGFEPDPDDIGLVNCFGTHQAVRGCSFASPARARNPAARRALLPEDDAAFVGFRTCTL